MASYHADGTLPGNNAVFVFGSNLGGKHGKGAALVASKRFGAVRGVGEGRTGDSYAIPTKDARLKVLPVTRIAEAATRFLEYAKANPDVSFWVTRIGCGLAGFTDAQMAPLFRGAGPNCNFAQEWEPFLKEDDDNA
ncbi:hypothetical protein M427DRAFT_62375 [Gonapodya prolifera JEL478]|uniref:Uncharacterized protein n=1 Tax=Gonapodya prolifera (strain JEL478) TaxID=1344416 RepID=A0A139A0U6_GONPJ|nr:hypothetical protein M427DRAFT_62375 [Gonapodya prolifera JEL478]|eukprot:KXS10399.1 hypothetical protein M427DRAFT_62375 [Gonapodya prolifera JEL478]